MPRTRREPKPPSAILRLEAFDMHGHLGTKPFDYSGFLNYLSHMNARARRDTVARRVIAIPTMTQEDGLYYFVAYEGQPGSPYLMFDLESDREEVGRVPTGKLLATRTVGVLDPKSRRAIIQFVYSGVRAAQVSTLFEKLAQSTGSDYRGASFEFALRAGESFRKQVSGLEIIKFAEMRLTKPNYDWNDYTNVFTDLAGKSGSKDIDVSATAPSDQSLSKSQGIVQIIRNLTTGDGSSILKKAVVKGIRPNENTITEIKLSRHAESKNVTIPKAPDGTPAVPQILEQAREFLRESEGR